MQKQDDKLHGAVYYCDDMKTICLNITSDLPIDSSEFYAFLLDFVRINAENKLVEIGEEIDMEFEEVDPSLCN